MGKSDVNQKEGAARWFREFGPGVVRRAERLLGNRDDALDVLQDVFLEYVSGRAKFRGESAPSTWLYSVTTYQCLNRIRNAKNRRRLLRENPVFELVGRITADVTVDVERLLAEMDEDAALVAIYYHVDHMSLHDIAALMGCSRRKVTRLLREAEALGGNAPEPALSMMGAA